MNDYFEHFGVLGQKWGVKNGPPYPLGSDVSTGKRLKKTKVLIKKKKKNIRRRQQFFQNIINTTPQSIFQENFRIFNDQNALNTINNFNNWAMQQTLNTSMINMYGSPCF